MGVGLSCCNRDPQVASQRQGREQEDLEASTEPWELSPKDADKATMGGQSPDAARQRSKNWARGTIFASSVGSGQTAPLKRTKKNDYDTTIVRAAVQQSTLLGAILAPQLQEMIDYMHEITIKIGSSVDLSGGMCVILEGKMEIKSGDKSGSAQFSKGDVVGDVGLLYNQTDDDLAHAKAIDTTRLYMLRRSVYSEVMEYSRCTAPPIADGA